MNDDGNDQDNDVQKSNNETILRRFFQINLFNLLIWMVINFQSLLPCCFSGHGWRVFTSGLSLIWKVEMPLLQKSCVKDLESFWQIKWSSFDLLSERPFKRTGKENLSSKHKRNRNTWSKKSMFLQASSNVGMDVKNRQSQHLFASNTKTNKYAFFLLKAPDTPFLPFGAIFCNFRPMFSVTLDPGSTVYDDVLKFFWRLPILSLGASLWSNVSSLKSHSLSPNSKVAVSQSVSQSLTKGG